MSAADMPSVAGIIRLNQLHVVLQPVVDLTKRAVYGYEALCRGPKGTELEAPLDLFAAAEKANLLPELDALALANALDMLPYLPPDTHLFVNVDPRSLERKPDLILSTLEKVTEPERVVVELTEHGDSSPEWQQEPLDRLRRLVERVALDDVGARYAELRSLVSMRPAFVKMDRSLVQGVGQDQRKADLLRVLVGLGERMSFTPVAEGVETTQDLRTLLGLGFRHAQGFVLGRPDVTPGAPAAQALAALG